MSDDGNKDDGNTSGDEASAASSSADTGKADKAADAHDMGGETSDAGDPKVARFPIEAHHVKKGKFVMLKGKPCKIMDVKTSKTGKHGHMKVNITGIDVLTGKKYNDVMPGHATMTEYKIDKQEYQLLDITNDGLSCLDADGNTCLFNCDPESEIGKKLKADFDAGKTLIVTILKAPVEAAKDKYNDEEIVESYKEDKSDAGDS